ncbi:hypothetical protein C1I91_24890 [Clostridium manihotivorum]|uniref:histidine kinase n=2 Tax=Clostridium manihotivorum TaxID=2320868 RepID=A0A410DZU1_9CLOT|nr:hypothetical protein C1I91_24890 [Clostridium manihotivorum]
MNHKSQERHISYFSIYMTFIFLILLQYGSSVETKISKSYSDGIILAEAILTLTAALAILIYLDTVKQSYILFCGLFLMVFFGVKLMEAIDVLRSGNSIFNMYNQDFICTKYTITNLIGASGIIFCIFNDDITTNMNGKKLKLYSGISLIIGAILYCLDVKVVYPYICNLTSYGKSAISLLNLLTILVLIIVLVRKEQEYKEPMVGFLIVATLLELFYHIYTYCDLGRKTVLFYFADIYFFLSVSVVIIGVCICLKERYKEVADSAKESNEVKKDILKYYKILEETPNYVFILDRDSTIHYANTAVENFVKSNYGSENIIGKNVDEVITVKNKKYSMDKISKVVDVKKKWSGESKLRGPNKIFYFNTYVSELIVDGKTLYLGIMNDNTDFIDMSLQLQKSEKKFRQITDSVHDLICKIDVEGRIDYCSPSYTNLFGGNYEEYKRVPWVHNVVEADIDKVLGDIKLCFEQNKTVTNECKMESGQNTYIYVNYVINPVEENGDIDGAIISARNITYKKLAEKELKESERKYTEIFNMCPDMIYVLDSKTLRITDVNPAMCELLGKTRDSILNRYLKQVFDDIDYESEINIIKYLNEGLIVRGHEVSFSFYGEARYLEVNYSPLIEDGELTKIICLARDITEKKKIIELKEEHEKDRKKLDETLQYDQLKTEFFANISHELRTPINVIFSVIQVLDLYRNDQNEIRLPYDKYSNVLRQNCYRLLRLINNLIDITKIDAGYLKLNCGMYDVVKIIEDITMSVVTYAENKGIDVIFDTYIEELYIYCDPDKIERIILNLLSNAIKFTDNNGKIFVLMELWGDSVRISVRDSGKGIPEDQLDIIFERFRQVDKSLAREHEGSGIGLSLVKSLVELHGGTVTAKSILNDGSEFIVDIPIVKIKEIQQSPTIITNEDNRIERINIEFSDIYEIS